MGWNKKQGDRKRMKAEKDSQRKAAMEEGTPWFRRSVAFEDKKEKKYKEVYFYEN